MVFILGCFPRTQGFGKRREKWKRDDRLQKLADRRAWDYFVGRSLRLQGLGGEPDIGTGNLLSIMTDA